MSEKKIKGKFEKESSEKIKKLEEDIENTENVEEIEALVNSKEELKSVIKLSEEAEEWIKKQNERTEKINVWKEETNYEYQKNIDIINDTIHKLLKSSIDDWYEDFRGEDIIDKCAMKLSMEKIKYDFMMPECVELETEVVKADQVLSGNSAYCVWIDYKFRMDENMAMHRRWKFDVTDIVRYNKMGWLFD